MTDLSTADASKPLQLPRRRFFNDMPDRGLFGLIALIGFFAIFALKNQNLNADLVALFAVVIMVFYGVAAYRIPAVAMRPDRLGDNFYYLGFIYTLASLSAALFHMRSGVEVNQVIGSFGIALVTTIVGIAGRVMFVQMRGNLDEIEEQTRLELSETASQLRGQLSASVREFEVFRTSLLQTLSETSSACNESTKQRLKEFDDVTAATRRQLELTAETSRTHIESLTDATKSLTRSVDQIGKKAEAMQLPTETLNAQVADFAKELEAILTRLGAIVDEVAKKSTRRRRWSWQSLTGNR